MSEVPCEDPEGPNDMQGVLRGVEGGPAAEPAEAVRAAAGGGEVRTVRIGSEGDVTGPDVLELPAEGQRPAQAAVLSAEAGPAVRPVPEEARQPATEQLLGGGPVRRLPGCGGEAAGHVPAGAE